MRKIVTALAFAGLLTPFAAQAADSRPGAVSYAAPARLGSGMRSGAAMGRQSKDDAGSSILLLAAGVGGGYFLHEAINNDHHDRDSSPN